MAQIQAGFNYNTTTNKIVTSDNLNGHVNNAILLPGSISQQNSLSGDLELTDNFLAFDISSGSLVKTTPQDIFDILPGSLKIYTITGYSNQDILIQPSTLSTVDTKVNIVGDLAVGSQENFDNPEFGIPALFFKEGVGTLNGNGSLGVTGNIINPTRGDASYGGVSWLTFGYPYSEVVGGRSGNSFQFQGVETLFKTSAPTSNIDHAVTVEGTVYIHQVQTEEQNPGEPNTEPALKVDGDVEVSGSLSIDGRNAGSLLPKAMGRFDKDGIPEGTKNFNLVCLKTDEGMYELTFNTPMSDDNYIVFTSIVGKVNPDASIQAAFELEGTRTENGVTIRTKNYQSGSAWADLPFTVMVYDL